MFIRINFPSSNSVLVDATDIKSVFINKEKNQIKVNTLHKNYLSNTDPTDCILYTLNTKEEAEKEFERISSLLIKVKEE